MSIHITILGLNRIGASIGLALRSRKDQVERIGCDRESAVNRQAEKAGAVDRTFINLPQAVKDADVVIMVLPVDEIRSTMEIIAPQLKPGAVLIDTSPVPSAAAEWAKELLPANDRYFISMLPALNPAYLFEKDAGVKSASADLFRNSLIFIASLPGTDESALDLATNLTDALGATPLFSDPAEIEGLLAASLILPRLTAAALINTTTEQPGWSETRKLAGPVYAQTTGVVAYPFESEHQGQSVLLNAANSARLLDALIGNLQTLRDALRAQDAEVIEERLAHAKSTQEEWIQQRTSTEWERKPSSIQQGGNFLGRFFGGRLPSKPSDEPKKR